VTIRSYLTRRWLRTWLGSMVVILALGVAMETVPKNSQLWNVLRALGIIVIAGLCWNLYRTRCPNCSKPMNSLVLFGRLFTINKCPRCGISLDSQVPSERQ
jgi:hypothetical protein